MKDGKFERRKIGEMVIERQFFDHGKADDFFVHMTDEGYMDSLPYRVGLSLWNAAGRYAAMQEVVQTAEAHCCDLDSFEELLNRIPRTRDLPASPSFVALKTALGRLRKGALLPSMTEKIGDQ